MKAALTRRRGITFGGGLALILVAFAGGYFVGDDSSQVSSLHGQVADLESEVESLGTEVSLSQSGEDAAREELSSAQDQLHAERSLNGKIPVAQEAEKEYNTDYPWQGAGTVGYLVIKPVDFSQEGENWILTIEAKNESSEPKEPFCGGAEAVLIDASDNNYSGEAVLGESSDNCGGDLQPGLTGTYKSEFKLPSGAKPVAAAIYGDYEQEEEAKTWELP